MEGVRDKLKFDGLFIVSNENREGVWLCYGRGVQMYGLIVFRVIILMLLLMEDLRMHEGLQGFMVSLIQVFRMKGGIC